MSRHIKTQYDYDRTDDCYVIKLSPDRYIDIFNSLDHYPMGKRDINQSVINYIEECSSDIPLSRNIKIEIQIKRELKNEILEDRARTGIRNYFQYILEYHRHNSKDVINISVLYIAIFIILTIMTYAIEASNVVINQMFLSTIVKGLSIGSWVFLWEAIAGLVIKNKKNSYLIKTYERLSKSCLIFMYL
jgi:hypothetical protein